jgi:hypothetical protein
LYIATFVILIFFNFSDPPIGDGGDRHEGQIHPPQVEEGSQLQTDGRRRVTATMTMTQQKKLVTKTY